MKANIPSIYFYISPTEYDWLEKYMQQVIAQDHFDEEEIADLVTLYHRQHYQVLNSSLTASNPLIDFRFNWIIQTYIRLKSSGFPCELTPTLPKEGIILLTQSEFSKFGIKPTGKQLLVYVKADRKYSHPYAQLQIVQNIQETKTVRNSFHIPHWVHSGLIPRDSSRGKTFETVAFFGKPGNLASELRDPSWEKKLQAMGLRWNHKPSSQWHDYSDVDVVLAVRSFDPDSIMDVLERKPASKLYNAWHANVPAILGIEPAFQEQRRSELDYLEVRSLEDVASSLEQLQNNWQLRQAIVENGQIRAKETTTSKIVKIWQNYLTDVAVPAYNRWCHQNPFARQFYIIQRYVENRMKK